MPQTIARMYRTQQAATAAVDELREQGFKAEAIPAHPGPSYHPDETVAPAPEPPLEPILKAGVPRAHALIYAEGIARGETLVVVIDPPFGFALPATAILDSHDPIAVNLPAAGPSSSASTSTSASKTTTNPTLLNSPAPLSSWLGWRVLTEDPTPLSSRFGWGVLKTDPKASKTLENIRSQSRDAAPLSSRIGMSPLSHDPAPLSGKLGMSVLSDNPAPLSKLFGWRTLSDNPTPLSSWLGWKVLSKS